MFDDTPLVFIRDPEQLKAAADTLAKASVIGVDTESDSFYSYQERVCLLQLSDLKQDYIIDPLAVGDLSPIAPLMADPSVVKILHGADYDIVCLKRDFQFDFHNVFDTLIASQLLGFEKIGLADLIGRFFGIEIEKKYQRHDWSKRPLLPEHIEYARGDTHFLLALREILNRKLVEADRIRHMDEECVLVSKREWQGRRFDPDGYLRMKKVKELDGEALKVLRRLWLFRDEAARKQNRPAFKVLPDQVLLTLAKERPPGPAEMDTSLPGKTPMKRRYGKGLLEAIQLGVDDPPVEKSATGKKSKNAQTKDKPGPRSRLRGRQADRVFNELKAWRSRLMSADRKLNPFTTASNAVLKRVASIRPLDVDELAAIPEIRNWQVEDYGTQILAVLDRVDPR